MTELPTPRPRPLGSITPSMANDLVDCGYRMAWRLDGRFKSLARPSPSSALGVAAHSVVEQLSRGLISRSSSEDEVRERLDHAWRVQIAKARATLDNAWSPASPPPPEEWPGYHLTRARLLRRAREVAERHGPATSAGSAAQVEKLLEDAGDELRGRPDRVEGPPGDRCVVDLKTGLAQAGPTVAQRRQLLLYVRLVQSATGERPSRMAIEDAAGRRWEESVDPIEVETAIADLGYHRSAYESAVKQDTPGIIARPSADTCRWCPYRLLCQPYWSSLKTNWQHGSVAGTVTNVRTAGQAAFLEIDATSPIDEGGHAWLVSAAPTLRPSVGSRTAIIGAELTGSARQLRWRWSTIALDAQVKVLDSTDD